MWGENQQPELYFMLNSDPLLALTGTQALSKKSPRLQVRIGKTFGALHWMADMAAANGPNWKVFIQRYVNYCSSL